MAIVLMKDINDSFTNTVNDLISKGYVISPSTHGGTYSSECGHIDLIKPKSKKGSDLIRVWLLEDTVRPDEDKYKNVVSKYLHIDTLKINVRKYKWNGNWGGNTLWPDCGENISDKTFYAVKRNRCYSDNIDEVVAKEVLSYSRYEARHQKDNDVRALDVAKLPNSFIEKMMSRLNKIKGFKRARGNCITKVRIYRDSLSPRGNKLEAYVDFDYDGKKATLKLK